MLYTLPPKQDFGHFLANAISSYSAGSQQYQKNQTEKMLLKIKLEDMLRKQKMTDAFTKLYDSLTGGADAGTDVLPGLEGKPRISSIGPSGPRISLPEPKTQMDLIRDIAAVAKQISELPEGSPQRKLAETTLVSLRKQLADMQGMEIKETPEVPAKSILGLDIPFTGEPAKTEVVPKGTVTQLQRPPVPAEEGKGSFWSLGPKVEMLKAYAQERAGVGSIGGELKTAYTKPGYKGKKPPPVPSAAGYREGMRAGQLLRKPEAPTDPEERRHFDSVDWFNLPTSKQAMIWKALDNGWTWADIAESLKGEKNAKPK